MLSQKKLGFFEVIYSFYRQLIFLNDEDTKEIFQFSSIHLSTNVCKSITNTSTIVYYTIVSHGTSCGNIYIRIFTQIVETLFLAHKRFHIYMYLSFLYTVEK